MSDPSDLSACASCGHTAWAHGDQTGSPPAGAPCHAATGPAGNLGCWCPAGYVPDAREVEVLEVHPFDPVAYAAASARYLQRYYGRLKATPAPAEPDYAAATELFHEALDTALDTAVYHSRATSTVDGDVGSIVAALLDAGWTPPTRKGETP